jgi:hypothetical protein
MLPSDFEVQLETETAALNRWLYDESVGLPVDDQAGATHAAALAALHDRLLNTQSDPGLRYFALESWSEARRVPLDNHVSEAMDHHLSVPALRSSEGPLTWRNWKAFERETNDPDRLADAFEQMVERSAATTPALEARLAQVRADFAAHGLTPAHTFAWREGTTPGALHTFLVDIGRACRKPFQAALHALSHSVFGHDVEDPANGGTGPAELRALYLNRMYEPNAPLFAAERAETPESKKDPARFASAGSAVKLIRETQSVFREIGFDLSAVPVDVENRPRKYPGAFCFPIAIPRDVRVSVRIASPHHLVDMLYHEFGHAAHFSGVRADLPFVDRYWIHSGAHETFSTLFESLLHEPAFLRAQFGFDDEAVRRLLEFARFKSLLTGTWLGAAALTALEGWLENLSWPAIESRHAAHFRAFTGVPMPPGFARLEPFTSALSIYPAGYVMAEVRVAHWRNRLRELGGEQWWRSPAAQADIRARIEAGGMVRFPEAWNEPEEFLRSCGADAV